MHTVMFNELVKYWQVFDNAQVITSFETEAEATKWCDDNGIIYTLEPSGEKW